MRPSCSSRTFSGGQRHRGHASHSTCCRRWHTLRRRIALDGDDARSNLSRWPSDTGGGQRRTPMRPHASHSDTGAHSSGAVTWIRVSRARRGPCGVALRSFPSQLQSCSRRPTPRAGRSAANVTPTMRPCCPPIAAQLAVRCRSNRGAHSIQLLRPSALTKAPPVFSSPCSWKVSPSIKQWAALDGKRRLSRPTCRQHRFVGNGNRSSGR